MSPEELAYRERLAQHLFDVRWPKEGDICPPVYDDYRTARRSPSALAALLLRVRGPVEVEGGAA